jgi:hypothetical protein
MPIAARASNPNRGPVGSSVQPGLCAYFTVAFALGSGVLNAGKMKAQASTRRMYVLLALGRRSCGCTFVQQASSWPLDRSAEQWEDSACFLLPAARPCMHLAHATDTSENHECVRTHRREYACTNSTVGPHVPPLGMNVGEQF